MTPKEKAKELYAKYHTPLLSYKDGININEAIKLYKCAKQCALIAVDELIKSTKKGLGITKYSKEYWQEVKKEIEQL